MLLAWLLVQGLYAPTFGQEAAPDTRAFPDADMTEQQWRSRVEAARRRSEDYIANIRAQSPDPIQAAEDRGKAADERAMNDQSLKRGDVVTTSKGFFVFVGTDEGIGSRATLFRFRQPLSPRRNRTSLDAKPDYFLPCSLRSAFYQELSPLRLIPSTGFNSGPAIGKIKPSSATQHFPAQFLGKQLPRSPAALSDEGISQQS